MSSEFLLASSVEDTEAEGPGKRFAFWVQGCHFNCPGCCNQEYLPFQGGKPMSSEKLLEKILWAKDQYQLEGVSILGGEPFTQKEPLSELVPKISHEGLSVMIYTGYRLEKLRSMNDPLIDKILQYTDLLVDGTYNQKLPDKKRRWIGSENQRLWFLSDFYSEEDPCFLESETVEFRLRKDGTVFINGWPDEKLENLTQIRT
jgi:anaerobic ribonucleoside-triphosphate reductase activating protein